MAEMDVELAAARRAVALCHVLADDIGRLRAGDENGAEVADERLDDVALFEIERVRGGDRLALLSEGAIEAADDFCLAEQRDEALLERARQAQVVVDFQKLLLAEAFRHGRRTLSSNRRMLNALLLRLEDDRIAVAIVAATAICVCAASGLLHGMPFPRYHDDYGYLLDADTFLRGRLSNPTHPLWPHFETMMVLHTPRYISKYPVGQGVLFAIGKLFGHPIVGEWMATVLACAAIWWALRVWTTARLALIGGIAVAIHPTMLGWVDSFHGGQLAALGGALMLAAAGRLRIAPTWQMSAVVGAGADILTISRPYEGLIFCIGIGLLLLPRDVLRVAWAGGLVLAAGLGFNAFRDYRITDNPLLLPYSLYEQRYDPVPNFIWETTRPLPHYRNVEMEDIYVNWYLAY